MELTLSDGSIKTFEVCFRTRSDALIYFIGLGNFQHILLETAYYRMYSTVQPRLSGLA